jgi:hypothetical protein
MQPRLLCLAAIPAALQACAFSTTESVQPVTSQFTHAWFCCTCGFGYNLLGLDGTFVPSFPRVWLVFGAAYNSRQDKHVALAAPTYVACEVVAFHALHVRRVFCTCRDSLLGGNDCF